MKTAKIISTFAVLFFLVSTVTASTSGEIIKTLNSKSLNHITERSSLVTLTESKSHSLVIDNSSVSMADNKYTYLKFYVNNYEITGSDLNETMELPDLDVEYLRFNVTNFIDSNEVNSVQSSDLPVDEYNYLRFDANKYPASISFAPNFGVMPANE